MSDPRDLRPLDAATLGSRDRSSIVRSLLPALVAFAIGGAISTAAFFALKARHVEHQRLAFDRQAAEITGALELGLDIPVEVLRSIPAFFDASIDVSRSEFRSFTSGLLERHPGVYALEWLPLVPREQRQEYEAAARADGLEGFQFNDDAGDGDMVRAASRPFHMPIYYMEPPNQIALGFDIASEQERLAPALKAARTGETVASPRIRLVEDDPSVYSIAVFHPVYWPEMPLGTAQQRRAALRGVAAEVFRMAPMVERALRAVDLERVDLMLIDRSAEPGMRLLYETTPGLYGNIPPTRPYRASIAFPFADRNWSMVAVAQQGYAGEPETAWSVLAAGLLLSALLSVGIGASTTISRLRRQMREALKLGQYTLVEKIGAGGMGEVYRARHAMLRRPTAIKLLKPGKGGEERLSRFEREVQMTSQLTHPNTIAIYDYGRTETGVLYYVMEYLEGMSFGEVVEAYGPVSAARAVYLLEQVCGSLAEAHRAGLIHRDINPANLMLCEQGGIYDFVKVLDFGLVKELDEPRSDVSHPGAVMGTPLYMAPEAIRAPHAVDARSDIYAVGGVAYFLTTGRPVFPGNNIIDVAQGHLHEEPAPPSRESPLPIPTALEELILRCLAKDPDARPSSARELREELARMRTEGVVGRWSQPDARDWWFTHEPGRFELASDSGNRSNSATDEYGLHPGR